MRFAARAFGVFTFTQAIGSAQRGTVRRECPLFVHNRPDRKSRRQVRFGPIADIELHNTVS